MTILLQKQLDYVAEQRIQLFRPSVFRTIIPVDNSVPTWADRVQHSEIRMSGEADPARIATTGPIGTLPRVTLSRADAYINILHFGYSYGYSIFDLERAAQTKINLPATEAVGTQTIVEQFLDAAVAGEKTTSHGLPGLVNQTATAVAYDGAAVATASLLTACAKAGGGTTWAGATYEEIARDIECSVQRVYLNTLQTYEATLVAMPPAQMFYLRTTRHTLQNVTLLSTLQAAYPSIRFVQWQRLATKDVAGTGPRLVTMATGPQIARLIVPQELRDEAPINMPLAVLIPQWFSVAGVLAETPQAICYTDGI
jgi:hypothetical protein